MTVTQSISVDLTTPVRQVVYSKTGDTNRYVEISLYNDGVAWDATGCTGVCYAEDEAENYYTSNNVSFSGNVCTALLPTFTVKGTANTEIEISLNGQTVATFDFYTEVYKSA